MIFHKIESWLILVTAAIVVLLGELLLIQQEFLLGTLLYAGMLQSILLYGASRWEQPQRYLLVLLIPSIIRLMNFTLPLEQLSPPFAQLVVSIPLAITAAVFVWLLREGQFRFNFQRKRKFSYLLLIASGCIVGIVLFLFTKPPPPAYKTPLIFIFNIFVILVSMAFLEEWLFRGIMQTALTHVYGGKIAVLVVALFYTILHINQSPWPFLLLIFVFALCLSWLRRNTDSLLDVCLVHGAANIVFFLVLPLYTI